MKEGELKVDTKVPMTEFKYGVARKVIVLCRLFAEMSYVDCLRKMWALEILEKKRLQLSKQETKGVGEGFVI